VGNDRLLVLERGQRNEIGAKGEKTLSRFESYRVLVEERFIPDAGSRTPRATPTLELLRAGTPEAQGELAWRFGLAAAALNLLLFGVGLAASNPRRPNNWNLLFALLAFAVYFNMVNVTQGWVAGDRIGLPAALLALHGGMLVLALLLLWWRDHGTVVRLAPRRHAAA
jgi:lipopolysaccharide export system permease protein